MQPPKSLTQILFSILCHKYVILIAVHVLQTCVTPFPPFSVLIANTIEGVRTKPRLNQFFSYLSLGYHRTKKKQCVMCLPQHIMELTNFEQIGDHFVQDKIKAKSTIFVLWYPKLKWLKKIKMT